MFVGARYRHLVVQTGPDESELRAYRFAGLITMTFIAPQ